MAGRNTPKNKTTKKLASEPTERRSPSVRKQVRRLYFGRSREAHRFRYALLSFDILIILFIVATSCIRTHDVAGNRRCRHRAYHPHRI